MRVGGLLIFVMLLPALTAQAADDGGSGAPQLKPPTFPLEPNKKTPLPINTASYVAAPSEPPKSAADIEAVIPKVGRSDDEWGSDLELGWFYDNVSADHSFQWTGSSGAGSAPVKRANANPLSLMGRFETRPPHSIFSGEILFTGTTGRAEAGGSGSPFAPQRFSVQDVQVAAGPALHLLSRQSAHDLSIGADAGYLMTSYTTLTPDFQALDVDNRQIVNVFERLKYRYVPDANWGLQASVAYGQKLSASGSGDVDAANYRRIEAETDAIRYLAQGQALGLGLLYYNESVDWSETAPVTLSDHVVTQDFRINLFWRREF